MPGDIKAHRKRATKAFQDARAYHGELHDIYKYFMPWRRPTSTRSPEGGKGTEGAPLTNDIFDGSPIAAAMNFAGTMQADWMPPLEEFFKLEAGPLVTDENERKIINEGLGTLNKVVHGVLAPVHTAVHEMMYDVFGGNGAMLINPADKWDNVNVLRGQAVPMVEMALQDGPYSDPWHVFWRRNREAGNIEAEWPNAKISDELNRVIKSDRQSPVEVTQYTYFDHLAGKWMLSVVTDKCKAEHELWGEELGDVSPWILPRMFKVPGESHGRGLGHIGLPFAKTGNKVRELALTAAAFAVMGIWMYRNDGVFNPDTSSFEPMALWPVQATGGSLGASIARLPVPQDFDVSSIVMKDEREMLNKVLMNDELPELADRVRSPTEITARLRRFARQKGGIGARMPNELVTPVVRRAIDILQTKGLSPVTFKGNAVKGKVRIDQILTQVTVTSPAIAAQRAGKLEAATNWLQILVSLFGPQTAMVASRLQSLAPEMGRWANVDERFIPSPDEMKELQDQLMQMMAQASQKPSADVPPPEQIANGYVNGSAAL